MTIVEADRVAEEGGEIVMEDDKVSTGDSDDIGDELVVGDTALNAVFDAVGITDGIIVKPMLEEIDADTVTRVVSVYVALADS